VILSILGIDKRNHNSHLRKTVLVYFIVSLIAIAVDHIYAIFGHGVSSAFMTWMFLYPLIGGAWLYLLIVRLVPGASQTDAHRLAFNLYNSGIAALTAGSFLKGILDIAGTSSPYTPIFLVAGWLFALAGLLMMVKAHKHKGTVLLCQDRINC